MVDYLLILAVVVIILLCERNFQLKALRRQLLVAERKNEAFHVLSGYKIHGSDTSGWSVDQDILDSLTDKVELKRLLGYQPFNIDDFMRTGIRTDKKQGPLPGLRLVESN